VRPANKLEVSVSSRTLQEIFLVELLPISQHSRLIFLAGQHRLSNQLQEGYLEHSQPEVISSVEVYPRSELQLQLPLRNQPVFLEQLLLVVPHSSQLQVALACLEAALELDNSQQQVFSRLSPNNPQACFH
jgi:hypothetical protein